MAIIRNLPAERFALLAAQAESGEVILGGVIYAVKEVIRGPWSPEAAPSILVQPLDGVEDELLIKQGLPSNVLSLQEAQEIDRLLWSRPGWRRALVGPQEAPQWRFYRGHPIAIYWSRDDRRWASLPHRTPCGQGAQEILLARNVEIRDEQDIPVQMELF